MGLYMLPGADGGRHPDVQRAQGAGRPRPGAAHRDGARHRRSASTTCTASGSELLRAAARRRSTRSVATLPGLDGRKMSKSYDNTIPLFAARKSLKEADVAHRHRLARAGRAQGPEGSALFEHLPGVRGRRETRRDARGARRRHRLGRGEAARCSSASTARSAPMRERYDALMAHPARIEDSCAKARGKAREPSRALPRRAARGGRPARPGTARCGEAWRAARQGRSCRIQAVPRGRRPFLFQADGRRAARCCRAAVSTGARGRAVGRPAEEGRAGRARGCPGAGRGGRRPRRGQRRAGPLAAAQ